MGVVSGLRVIGWAIVLLLMVVYAIGVVMRHLSAQQMRNEVRGMIMMSMHLRKFCWRSTAGAENVCVWRWAACCTAEQINTNVRSSRPFWRPCSRAKSLAVSNRAEPFREKGAALFQDERR